MSDDTVILARFATRHEAEIAQGYLADAGIPAGVFADDAGGMEPNLAFVRPPRLIVLREFEERARGVLADAGLLGEESDPEVPA